MHWNANSVAMNKRSYVTRYQKPCLLQVAGSAPAAAAHEIEHSQALGPVFVHERSQHCQVSCLRTLCSIKRLPCMVKLPFSTSAQLELLMVTVHTIDGSQAGQRSARAIAMLDLHNALLPHLCTLQRAALTNHAPTSKEQPLSVTSSLAFCSWSPRVATSCIACACLVS